MKHTVCVVLVLFAAGASGCQAVPAASTPRSITLNGVSNGTIEDATAQAEAHCAKQGGRHAQLVPDPLADGRATFNCVQ